MLPIAALCALLLALPGETVTTKYVNDLFVFLDGAHRIDAGQVPNRHFHTALGPLTFYIPAIGYWLTGSWGAAMPVGMALLTALMAPVASHIVRSRLRPLIGVPLGAYLLLVLAMPLNPGESIRSLSFAMFYNRVGWTALGFLLLMYLQPVRRDQSQCLLDAVCAVFLALLMLYTKASYGLVALGFLVFMLLDARQRGWVLSGLLMIVGAGLGIEAVWRSTLSHVADLATAARVSGGLGTPDQVGDVFMRNLADYAVFALLAAFCLVQTRSFRDLLFFGFSAAAGFLLIRQNFQVVGIVILAPAAAVAAQRISNCGRPRRLGLAAGAPIAALALVIPPLFSAAAALGLHASLALSSSGTPVPLDRFRDIRLVRLWAEGEYPGFVKYFETLQDGGQTLATLNGPQGPILVLDFVNPFSAGLGLPPAIGDSPWFHWGRTLNETTHPPAAELFAGVRMVMDPKSPIEGWTAGGMRDVYAAYVAETYDLAAESEYWRVYARKAPEAPALTPARLAAQ